MREKRNSRTCPDVMSNECIVWQSGDVSQLNIYNGDPLNDAEANLATAIVDLYSKVNMSQIDMHCIEDTCAQSCKDTSLFGVIQTLFDNQCCLNDLITGPSADNNLPTITVNMRCLTVFDDFGNIIVQDLNQSIQSLVNQTCTNTTNITALTTDFSNLQSQVDAINTTPITPPEVNITTCLTSLRPISQTVPIVAKAICDFQTLIGSSTDVTQAMSEQCADLNSTFASVQGWLTSVSNMAQSFNNLWLVACNLNSRVTNIEKNCCAVTCDDVKVGFDVAVDSSGTGVFLKFTAGAGTSIPNAFTDAGSSVTFTDKNGNYVTYPLVISNNANEGDFDLSGLDLTDPITISVTAIMGTSGLTCEKCITRLYTLANTSCPVCQITASGTTGNVTIAYTLPGSTNIQTLILQNGQVGYIQTNAVIMSVVSTGDVTASSTCINLTPPPMACYIFYWAHSTTDDDTLDEFIFNTLMIGNLSYTISTPYEIRSGGGSDGAPQALFAEIAAKVPAAICQPMCVLNSSSFLSKLSVQVPQNLPAPILKATAPTGVGGGDTVSIYLYGTLSTNASTDCGCNVSSGGGGGGTPD